MPVLACPFRAAGERQIAQNRRAFGALNVFGRLKEGATRGAGGQRGRRDLPHLHAGQAQAGLPAGDVRLPRHDDSRARSAHQRRARAAADPARHHRAGVVDRVRERRQPHAGADAGPRSRAGDARRARRRPRPPGPAAADREHAAGGGRRRDRHRLRVADHRHADDVRRPVHLAHRRDHARSDRAGLHARRLDLHRACCSARCRRSAAASIWCRR